jgi:hypothetical protein
LNPAALLGNQGLVVFQKPWEMDMVSIHPELVSSNLPAARGGMSGLAFAGCVAAVLVGFAVLSIASGATPIDPAIFATP